jgi:hypothetical protein
MPILTASLAMFSVLSNAPDPCGDRRINHFCSMLMIGSGFPEVEFIAEDGSIAAVTLHR